jgi:hypothetical protein
MYNVDFPKSIRKQFRAVTGALREMELRQALEKLKQDFGEWEEGKIDSFDLSDRIHEFHNGASREIYVRYTSRFDPRMLVRRAIEEGLITLESIPGDLRPYMEEHSTPWRAKFERSLGDAS